MYSLEKIKEYLLANHLRGALIRSTDVYFNEYVPKENSIRYQITGFSGSVGDAIILDDSQHLFVDGRYSLQAQKEATGFIIHVAPPGTSIEDGWLKFLHTQVKGSFAYDPELVDLNLWDKMQNIKDIKYILINNHKNNYQKNKHIWPIDKNISGQDFAGKLKDIKNYLKEEQIDGLLLVKLDDIAWVYNLRSDYFANQKTFPSQSLILQDRVILSLDSEFIIDKTVDMSGFIITNRENFYAGLKNITIGVDPSETSKAHFLHLQNTGCEIKRVKNPVKLFKAIKNEQELHHLYEAYQRADKAVFNTICHVENMWERGQKPSELSIKNLIKEQFAKEGAQGLSFEPICAAQKNGAVIHYGDNSEELLSEGDLFLLDTGAYFEGGYATDLTRTFLIGGPETKAKAWQKKMFTLVLKASIAGLSARIKKGALGCELDAIVRYPLWQAGVDFAHGTGHGIGISVHEFPPRIAPKSQTPLMPHQVFSIEPGIYIENLGGVRIENLCTLVEDDEANNFLRVLPLTFCPLDNRLIDDSLLSDHERYFLAYYKEQFVNKNSLPSLIKLPKVNFIGDL